MENGYCFHLDDAISDALDKRYHWQENIENCPYDACKESNGFLRVVEFTDSYNYYYLTSTDIDSFVSGYKKMMDLDISDVNSYTNEFHVNLFVKNHDVHNMLCRNCGYGEPRPTTVECEKLDFENYHPKNGCKAYWYFL